VDSNLSEWDYGDYEGRTTPDIRKEIPDWSLWVSGVPNGEAIGQVAGRAQAIIARAVQAGGDVALFSHGHMLRVLASCWVGLPPQTGRFLALGTASLSALGYERATRVITRWNLSVSG
jgi:probable phosphoglycerate mutase